MTRSNAAVDDDEDASGWAEVIAFDPGGTTGWSVFLVHPEALSDPDTSVLMNVHHWEHGQLTGRETHVAAEMLALAMAWPHAVLVIEDFILRTQSKSRDVLSPVRLTFGLEFGLAMREDPRRLFTQSARDAKSTCTDDRLKEWGYYKREGGEEHARDADRHSLLFLRRAKKSPKLRAAAWAHLFGEGVEG